MSNFYTDIIKEIAKSNFTEKKLTQLKRSLAQKYTLPKTPSNIQILMHAPNDQIESLRLKLQTKPVRSLSGVSPIALMTAPSSCPHGKCTYCPGGPGSFFGDVPMSYTGKEPSTMRAIRNHYDPYLITFNRLEQFVILGHSIEKIEIIIQGGTFPATSQEYQDEFIKYTFKALNDFSIIFFNKDGSFNYAKFKEFFELPLESVGDPARTKRVQQKVLKYKTSTTLEQEQDKNQTAKVRCIALCIETKPDWGLLEHANQMLRLGCTRIELGIQSVYQDVIKAVHRGHTVQDSLDSIQILKDLGFKITAHYMPGLPLTSRERDIAGMKQLFTDPNYRPDSLKIYPTMVSQGTALYHQYKQGTFTPIDANEAAIRMKEFLPTVPQYCRIMRVQRDVPTKQWAAGVEMTNFRQYFEQKYSIQCQDIRTREPMGRSISWPDVIIQTQEYHASGGTEIFIQAVDTKNDILVGFARLRFPSQSRRPEITSSSAILRELHIYGTATSLRKTGDVQHKGWGTKLMQQAESIAKEHNKTKMVVISGIGVRQYYSKQLGYHLEGPYMVKEL